jgi:hypothetical protein
MGASERDHDMVRGDDHASFLKFFFSQIHCGACALQNAQRHLFECVGIVVGWIPPLVQTD